MLPSRTFLIPPTLITGNGSSEQIGEQIKNLGVKKVLIVTDKVMSELGIAGGIEKNLVDGGLDVCVFDKVLTEPTVEFVTQGVETFKNKGCEAVVAVGGGSPIDTAKAISVMAANPGSIEQYKGLHNIPKPGAPVIAVPTTAGTGSEVTIFTIITDTATDVKMLIGSTHVLPRIAVVDPVLTLSCPRGLTAAVGIDALTHAIEAYVSLKAQPMSDVFSLSAISLISGFLRQAWANGDNLEAREKVMLGALQAGIGFSNASVALVHGMSRPIGAYFHVPHGASNAVLLGAVTEFSLMGNPGRYADVASAMGEDTTGLSDMEAAGLAAEAIKELIRDIQIPPLKDLGVDKGKLEKLAPQMAEDAIASGSPGNNPRKATKEEIVALYHQVYSEG